MSIKDKRHEFSELIYDNLSYEKIVKFIKDLDLENEDKLFFTNGNVFLDEVFFSRNIKFISTEELINILNLLDFHKARYSDATYVEALWYPAEIQTIVKRLPREYSERHIEDTETF